MALTWKAAGVFTGFSLPLVFIPLFVGWGLVANVVESLVYNAGGLVVVSKPSLEGVFLISVVLLSIAAFLSAKTQKLHALALAWVIMLGWIVLDILIL